MADNQGGTGGTSGNTPTSLMRDYRKGNWTVSETMILIEAKKMDDERRMKRSSGAPNEAVEGGSGGGGIRINKPAELRWKWVEDYCWRKGCLRSQNQCNDKWDNLMRDYKKVRDYERRLSSSDHDHDHQDQSYWKIEKNERKEKNLPTNMLPQIYEALVEVVEKKSASHQRVLERTPSSGGYNVTTHHERASTSVAVISATSTTSLATTIVHQQQQHQQQVQASLMASHLAPVILQHHVPAPLPLPAPAPGAVVAPSPVSAVAPVLASPIQAHQPLPYVSQPVLPTMCDSSDSDTSEHSDSPAKRRRKSAQHSNIHHQYHHQDHNIQATTTTTTTSGSQRHININPSQSPSTTNTSTSQEVASAISKSASVIAEALQASEEREERRHRELLGLHERRLQIEESKNEINRQGISGLVEAINNLANSIQALASDRHGQSASRSQPPS